MSLTARKLTHIPAAEYPAAGNGGAWRHEFVNGAVFARAVAGFFAPGVRPAQPGRRGLELFRRCTDWQREFYQRDNAVAFESVGLTLSVSRLYRDIESEDPTLSGT
jgi:hypothetical protein